MNWRITNGVLFSGNQRIVLAAITDYRVEMETVVINCGARTISLHARSDAASLGTQLDDHFQNPVYVGVPSFEEIKAKKAK